MEEIAGSPQEDDGKMAEAGSKNLLVKIFFRHAIVHLEVVGRGNPIPNPTSCRILSQILAKFWEFCCHKS